MSRGGLPNWMRQKTPAHRLTNSQLAVELWATDYRLSKLEAPKETAQRRMSNRAEDLREKLIESGHIEQIET